MPKSEDTALPKHRRPYSRVSDGSKTIAAHLLNVYEELFSVSFSLGCVSPRVVFYASHVTVSFMVSLH